MAPIFLSANPRPRNFIWLKEHYKSQASVYKETHFAKKKNANHTFCFHVITSLRYSCQWLNEVSTTFSSSASH